MQVLYLLFGAVALGALTYFVSRILRRRPKGTSAAVILGSLACSLLPIFFLVEAATNTLGLAPSLLGVTWAIEGMYPAYALATPVFWVAGAALSARLTERHPILSRLPGASILGKAGLSIAMALLVLFVILMFLPWIDYLLYAYKRNYLFPGLAPAKVLWSSAWLFAGSSWWAFALLFLGLRVLVLEHPARAGAWVLLPLMLFALPYLGLSHMAAVYSAENFSIAGNFPGHLYRNAAPVLGLLLAGAGAVLLGLTSRDVPAQA